MDKTTPLISLVTVVYNDKDGLEATIKSVISQTYKNIELIVVDGKSIDGTVNIINKYKDEITYSISESDKGIYDAMNKGLILSNGDFVNFLNAGDVIHRKDALEKIVLAISDLNYVYFARARVTYGNQCWVYPNMNVDDYILWLEHNLPNHQAMFFPRSFYSSYFYDLRLTITGDDDYKLLALKACDVKFIDQVFVEFERDGISSNHKSAALLLHRISESIIINLKHKRLVRLFSDPLKRLIFFVIHRLFGGDVFFNFIKQIKKL